MGKEQEVTFTFEPVWVIEDLLVFIATAATIFYIVKREAQPIARLMEMFAFVLLDSAIYENVATLAHLYEFGRSSIMVFNIPIAVPLFEYMVLYGSLKLFERTRMPVWLKPIGAGFFGVVADFTLDPVSVYQRFRTLEGTIGRWTWFPGPGEPTLATESVKNFSGWMLIIGFGAIFVLLGREWHRRSGFSALVGYLYPIIAAVLSLLLLLTPVASFLLNVWPFFPFNGPSEWAPLAVYLIVPPVLLAVFWRGRMKGAYTLKGDFPVFVFLGGFPIVNLLFTIIGGYTPILSLELIFTVVMELLLASILLASRRWSAKNPAPAESVRSSGATESASAEA